MIVSSVQHFYHTEAQALEVAANYFDDEWEAKVTALANGLFRVDLFERIGGALIAEKI